MVILGNHDHPVHPFQQTGIQQPVFRFKPQGLFPKRYCRYELDTFVSLPDLQDRLRSSHIKSAGHPGVVFLVSLPVQFCYHSSHSFPDLCKYPGIVSNPLQNTFLTVSCESHCLIVSCFQLDQESCIYADKVRSLRQKEYDNASLYSETDAEQAEQLERSRCNFIEYFDHVQRLRHAHSSDSIIINWKRVHELLKIFAKGDTILFSQIDLKLIESFRMFLLNAPQGGGKKGVISQNTASTYFSIFKAALKQAFIDGYLTVDIRAKIKGIQGQESRREYLTIEELNRLAQTPCGPLLKRAALFSALTGLRHCDIQKLKWSEIEVFNGGYRLNFTQQKTKGVEYMPISEQAFQLCGERKDGEQLVFAGLPDPSWINRPIKKWVAEAGITKHITYHCARHSVFSFSLKFNSLQNISA